MTAALRTPHLARDVADHGRLFGFACRQHIRLSGFDLPFDALADDDAEDRP